MKIEVKVPSPGESITQVQLANWLVENGSLVEKDQEIAEIDSDKATLSISAEQDGKISILVEEGETVEVGAIICTLDTEVKIKKPKNKAAKPAPLSPPKAVKETPKTKLQNQEPSANETSSALHISPLARKLMQDNAISEEELLNFLKSYRISKKDIAFYQSSKSKDPSRPTPAANRTASRQTERKKMSTLRIKLSERLVAVKNETAMLTTFNEVNMTPIMEIRRKHKDAFKEKYGVGLGFMSFFTRAVSEALQLFPQVNAQIIEDGIIYHNYSDIGIAVSTPKGLMVPIIRNAESLSFSQIELKIKEMADKARNNKITIQDMEGGTFTITNGGVFGSMMSTPILNPPQSAILGMHNIVDRPIAVQGKIEIHPMMYIALSYDHRIIDGRESVSFLLQIKQMLEEPIKLMFGGSDPEKIMFGLK